MKKEFNQQKYVNGFNKDNYLQFNVRLKKAEKEELDKLLEKAELSGTDFVKKGIRKLKEELEMLTSGDLLVEVMELGFDREYALAGIDSALDETFGSENRKDLDEEVISTELYNNILDGFICEKEADEYKKEMEK